jgi:hypothetical protein
LKFIEIIFIPNINCKNCRDKNEITSLVSLAQLVGQLHYIYRSCSSNLGHPTIYFEGEISNH